MACSPPPHEDKAHWRNKVLFRRVSPSLRIVTSGPLLLLQCRPGICAQLWVHSSPELMDLHFSLFEQIFSLLSDFYTY